MFTKDLSNIWLIGFMGTGKSTIGPLVARKLNKKFIEADREIEREAKMAIPEIFKSFGEIRFRELEIEVTRKLSSKTNHVFSMGGGVILNYINVMYMRRSGVIIRLTASKDEIVRRILRAGKEKRPMVARENPEVEIERLLDFREPFYMVATHHVVDTTGLTLGETAKKVIDIFNRARQDMGI
ncbi:MAG: shikimate kinase [Promethearchaeota archaeon]